MEPLLKISILGGDRHLKFSVSHDGGGKGPSAVRLIDVVVGAPPFVVPVNRALVLRIDAPPIMSASDMEICTDCECFHPRPADCPGPALK